MKKLLLSTIAFAVSSITCANAFAADHCKTIYWDKNKILKVKSSMYIGSRIQFPANLLAEPINSSKDLWSVSAAGNQLVVKPRNGGTGGKQSAFRVYTTDGEVYDLIFDRVGGEKNSDICVIVENDNNEMPKALKSSIDSYTSESQTTSSSMMVNNEEQERNKKEAIAEALRLYRYHIYTRYNWGKGKGFSGKNIISDVYDDGRWTYIRVANNNKGTFALTSKVGDKEAIIPYKYDDVYGIYQVSGIYPEFTLKLNSVEVKVIRSDANSNGES